MTFYKLQFCRMCFPTSPKTIQIHDEFYKCPEAINFKPLYLSNLYTLFGPRAGKPATAPTVGLPDIMLGKIVTESFWYLAGSRLLEFKYKGKLKILKCFYAEYLKHFAENFHVKIFLPRSKSLHLGLLNLSRDTSKQL